MAYEDGDFDTLHKTGQLIGEAPFAEYGDNTEYLFRQTVMQRGTSRVPTPIGLQDDQARYFIGDSPANDIGYGIQSWVQTWALIPARQEVFGTVVRTYQQQTGQDGENLLTLTKTVPAVTYLDFYFAPGESAQDIPLISASKLVKRFGLVFQSPSTYFNLSGKPIVVSDKRPVPLSGQAGRTVREIHEDSTLTQWRGPIWQRSTTVVRRYDLTNGEPIA